MNSIFADDNSLVLYSTPEVGLENYLIPDARIGKLLFVQEEGTLRAIMVTRSKDSYRQKELVKLQAGSIRHKDEVLAKVVDESTIVFNKDYNFKFVNTPYVHLEWEKK